LALVKVPDPFEDQVITDVFEALDPAVIFTSPVVEQIDIAAPASAVGAGVIVTVLFDVATAAHGVFGLAVRVRSTFPAAISPTLGVYVHPVNDVALVSVPAVPLEVHSTPLLFETIAPAVILTATEFEQIVTSVPATDVGALVIVRVLADVAFEQAVLPLEVKVSVILPALISPMLGV
jgi:hypothetical protein